MYSSVCCLQGLAEDARRLLHFRRHNRRGAAITYALLTAALAGMGASCLLAPDLCLTVRPPKPASLHTPAGINPAGLELLRACELLTASQAPGCAPSPGLFPPVRPPRPAQVCAPACMSLRAPARCLASFARRVPASTLRARMHDTPPSLGLHLRSMPKTCMPGYE